MSQSNKGVLAVVAGGCFLGLALGLGYLFYWAPRVKAEAARNEIREWGVRWGETRSCILGEQPPSGDALEAMVARELTEPELKRDLGRCMKLLKELPREEGASTEEQEIEDAWYAMRVPLGKLAQAHAWRTAREPDKTRERLWTNVATAVTEIDSRYQELLQSADISAPAKNAERLRAATLVQRLESPTNEDATITDVALHRDLITYSVQGEDATHIATLTGDGKSRFSQLSPLALRAADGDWGLWIENDGIPLHESQATAGARVVAGPLDEFGEPAADGTLLHTIAEGEQIWLRFAVGEQSRVALIRRAKWNSDYTTWENQLLRSDDAGASWSPIELPSGDIYVSLKRAAQGNYITWQESTSSTVLYYQELSQAGTAKQILNFGGKRAEISNWPPELCQAQDRNWWIVDGRVYTIAKDQKLVRIPGTLQQDPNNYEQSMSCSSEGFAVTSRSYSADFKDLLATQTCDLQSCKTKPKHIPAPISASFYPVFEKGRLSVIVSMGGFAAVWRPDSDNDVEVFSLGSTARMTGAIFRQESLQVVLWPEEATSPELLKLR